MRRHERQMRLAEVGPEGQARLAASRVDVPLEGTSAHIAALYLAGAGVGELRVRDRALAESVLALDPGVRVEVAPSLPVRPNEAFDLRDPSAREVAAGALLALDAVRRGLEGQR
jgi:hypothetical protein